MRTRVPEYDEVPPYAPSLVNSMCASGYDLESAVADIIDNSISAKSSSVRIIVNEDGASSWIAIADDGRGMDDATLRNAMTFGCIDPSDAEGPRRSGTVRAGAQDGIALAVQAADRVDEAPRAARSWSVAGTRTSSGRKEKWALLRKGRTPHLEERFRRQLQTQPSGTVVLWEVLDRLGHDSAIRTSLKGSSGRFAARRSPLDGVPPLPGGAGRAPHPDRR